MSDPTMYPAQPLGPCNPHLTDREVQGVHEVQSQGVHAVQGQGVHAVQAKPTQGKILQ